MRAIGVRLPYLRQGFAISLTRWQRILGGSHSTGCGWRKLNNHINLLGHTMRKGCEKLVRVSNQRHDPEQRLSPGMVVKKGRSEPRPNEQNAQERNLD